MRFPQRAWLYCSVVLGTLAFGVVVAVHSPPPKPSSSNDGSEQRSGQSRAIRNLGRLPLYFIENQGQTDEAVAYYIKGHDKTIYFTSEGLTFSLAGPDEGKPEEPRDSREARFRRAAFERDNETPPRQRWTAKWIPLRLFRLMNYRAEFSCC